MTIAQKPQGEKNVEICYRKVLILNMKIIKYDLKIIIS